MKVLVYSDENFIRKNLVEHLSQNHEVEEMGDEGFNKKDKWDVCFLIMENEDVEFTQESIKVALRCAPRIILINPILGNTELDFVPTTVAEASAAYAEHLLKVTCKNYSIVRLGKLVGARHLDSGLAHDYILNTLQKKPFEIPDGEIQLTSIESILPTLEKLLDSGNKNTYNLGNENGVKIPYLCNFILAVGAKRGFKTLAEPAYKSIDYPKFSVEKARNELGWTDEKGLLEIIESAFINLEIGD